MRPRLRIWKHGTTAAVLATACAVAVPWLASAGDDAATAPWLGEQQVAALKFAVALGGVAVLLWGALLRRAGRPGEKARLRGALLLVLGLLGACGWWNFLQFRYTPGFGHALDIYHYYIGAKYFDELRYNRLYECTTVADAESGDRALALQRSIRNLKTYRRESAALILQDPTSCTRHFSPERWETFKHDVGWFHARIPEDLWRGMLADYGYNPTPAWGAVGNLFIRDGPVSEATLSPLVLIDPLLLISMWAFCLRAFGWRATSVALIFWGTNLPSDYLWTGGAFLRQGWLAALVMGICCLRLRWMAIGGFLLTVATLLRVFPGMAVFGVVLGAGIAMAREQSGLDAARRRFALGCAAAAAILIPLSIATAGGAGAWVEFAENIWFHSSMPFGNNVGLRTVLSYDHDLRIEQIQKTSPTQPQAWIDAQNATFERRRLAYGAIVLGYLALLALAVRDRPDWENAALGVGGVVLLTTMSGYYFGLLLVFGFAGYQRAGLGAALCGLAAFTWCAHWLGRPFSETYAAISLGTVAFVLGATACAALRRGVAGSPGAGDEAITLRA